ncbi:hypothetical protein [Ornithinimicrobium murale]|uniref:hypothetical protein n=1 Tax=Ornithinimicrobium murale TaxID=1050153 RepID=UPI000E0D54D3|nr:hypothetical protein [Ornithinimicrobium murale]
MLTHYKRWKRFQDHLIHVLRTEDPERGDAHPIVVGLIVVAGIVLGVALVALLNGAFENRTAGLV